MQFSASSLSTSYDHSSYVNCVPNPLDGESNEFVSSDSEGYVETEIEWFNEPQPGENAKHYPSKKLETLALKVCFASIFPSLH